MSPRLTKITFDEIVLIHDRIVEETGGTLGVREPNLLESICQKQFGHYYGKELYPGIFLKSAVIFVSLANYHIFVDGNKRSAISVLEYFLSRQGFSLLATKDQKERFILKAAQTNNPDLAEIATWIKQHAKKDMG